ncbi:MAG TPA: TonB-dependent receptor [Chitinophaga sp.]|uniref:TonB-dependent receptor n=1 Tax=Chitinophaga sp. TaxID=1869181 RepID=UPI002DB7C914|nr:TonB-dependent receptor [Chitinophaga sp.]HEU4551438.1 TonB-dependent receptor [Chitinophaga sp.]
MAQKINFRAFLQRAVLVVILVSMGFGAAFANDEENGGTIKGTVTTSDNKPAAAVTVLLKGTKKGARTNDDGTFQIRNVAPGTYTVEVSLIGYETVAETVTIAQQQTVTVQLRLDVSEKSLSEVVVTGAYSRFNPPSSEYVAKLPLKNIENPQVYASVGSAMIKEQAITSYDDALKNAPGLSKLWSSTGRGGDGAGYYTLRGFAVQPALVNGLAGLTNSGLDVANVERIEVIKGPSGTLFGSTLVSYGGLINTVTKRPYDHFGGSVSFTSGSYGLNRFTADINTPLDKDQKVLLRVIGAYHDENSFQDAGFKKNRFFAPSLTYKASDKLTFMVNAAFLSAEGTNPTMLFFDRASPLKAKNLEELGYNKKNSFTSNNISIKTPTTTLQAQMQYKLSDQWTSQTILSRSSAKSQGYYSYLYETSTSMPVPSTFARYVSDQNYTTTATDIQQNFIGDFKLGSMRNRVVIGVDYLKQDATDNSTGYVLNGVVDMTGFDSGILSRQHMDSLLEGTEVSNSNLSQEVISGYISDVFNFLPQLSAMASLRLDHFKTGGLSVTEDGKYDQTTLSPKFGVVYQPVLNIVSLFANYMNGFTNSAPRRQNDGTIKTFKPERANQWEAGIKTNLVADILTATVSYYDIKVSNTIMQDPTRVGFYTQGGRQYSRGIDADIVANPVNGLNIVAGYSYNESKVTETDAHDYLGRRPEGAGPQHLANAWISYKCPSGRLEGFGAGFGGNYGGENMVLNRETTGVFTLPSYTVLNAALFYNTKKFNITLKLDNLTNKEYYKGWSTLEPQMPRRFSASGTFNF